MTRLNTPAFLNIYYTSQIPVLLRDFSVSQGSCWYQSTGSMWTEKTTAEQRVIFQIMSGWPKVSLALLMKKKCALLHRAQPSQRGWAHMIRVAAEPHCPLPTGTLPSRLFSVMHWPPHSLWPAGGDIFLLSPYSRIMHLASWFTPCLGSEEQRLHGLPRIVGQHSRKLRHRETRSPTPAPGTCRRQLEKPGYQEPKMVNNLYVRH